ncbi:hypothetical protein ACFWUQ_05075 [Streptomyces sp. NPDC058662]|uniref:hypothetical protein n=1 Tax=Streptomyces sp. NPDC058662 TaxID=3346583 RepID=UPI00365FB30E
MSNVFGSISIVVAASSAVPALWLAIRSLFRAAPREDAPVLIKLERNGVQVRITGPQNSDDIRRIVELLEGDEPVVARDTTLPPS